MGTLRGIGLACLLVAGLVTVLGPGAGPASADPTTARILIVGDSVTQGDAGDYTWRYRLWKTLQSENKAVDFVGPRQTLRADSDAYADPDFDQDHAAHWGAWQTIPAFSAHDLTNAYAPDIVLNDLGINDLRYDVTPEALVSSMEQFVTDVRAVRPRAAVVIGQLTQRWFTTSVNGNPVDVDAYNALLVDLATELDRPDARVLVATAPGDYTDLGETYDSSHPNAQGEIKIAQQFADALATLPLPDRPAPPPAPAYAGAARLAAQPRHRAVRLDFTVPAGATTQAVWKRNVTRDGRWRFVAYVGAGSDHYRVGSLRRHHRYAFKTRAYQGTTASVMYSNVDRARVR